MDQERISDYKSIGDSRNQSLNLLLSTKRKVEKKTVGGGRPTPGCSLKATGEKVSDE